MPDAKQAALRAMETLSRQAQENGTANMTLEEVNTEIAAARAEREDRELDP